VAAAAAASWGLLINRGRERKRERLPGMAYTSPPLLVLMANMSDVAAV
jgi:hypothetical protein